MKQCNDCERNLALRPNIYREIFVIIFPTALDDSNQHKHVKVNRQAVHIYIHTEAITSPTQAKFREKKTPLNHQKIRQISMETLDYTSTSDNRQHEIN